MPFFKKTETSNEHFSAVKHLNQTLKTIRILPLNLLCASSTRQTILQFRDNARKIRRLYETRVARVIGIVCCAAFVRNVPFVSHKTTITYAVHFSFIYPAFRASSLIRSHARVISVAAARRGHAAVHSKEGSVSPLAGMA